MSKKTTKKENKHTKPNTFVTEKEGASLSHARLGHP